MGVERMVMFGAVVLWAAVSLASRAWGGVLGALMGLGVGVWGHLAMASGKEVTVMGLDRPLTRPAFFVLVSFIVFINALTALQAFRLRRVQKAAARAQGG